MNIGDFVKYPHGKQTETWQIQKIYYYKEQPSVVDLLLVGIMVNPSVHAWTVPVEKVKLMEKCK